MLNIFYGRESIDKEKFIYENIAKKQGRTLVIVPDQYTLEAEKQAFRLLRAKGLIDVEIVSMSRLGYKLISELGGGKRTFIDKYGRHMLLSQIAAKEDENLQVFRGRVKKNSFIEKMNNFISEMKQYNVKPGELKTICEAIPGENLLKQKLEDLNLIYSRYEEKIKGKYTDSEDYIELYMNKIPQSKLIQGSNIFIYGFDSFAPKALSVLGRLMENATEVNIFLTYDHNCRDEDLFKLTEIVMKNLEKQANQYSISHKRVKVSNDYIAQKNSNGLKAIERELFTVGKKKQAEHDGITIVQAANIYNEAESAASYILHLLRDKGMRYRDIAVICNDDSGRISVVNRVFDEYGIESFDDKKRSILNSPIAIYIVSMLETIVGKYRTTDVFKVLKTGFTEFDNRQIEVLENYVIKYRIHGTMWKTPFIKGVMDYGSEKLADINQIRENIVSKLEKLEKVCKSTETVGAFTESFYDFLIEELSLDDKIMKFIEIQEDKGLIESAAESEQVWGKIIEIFDQINELCSEEPFRAKDFNELLSVGLSEIEVGVLPPTSDDILMGTMQRTRSGQVKAVLLMGANEGIIPAVAADDGLFSLDELELLSDEGKDICKVDKIRVMEEKLAIYRNLSKPTDYLWISYSASGEDGKTARQSSLIDDIQRIFPNLKQEKDILNRTDMIDAVGGRINTLRHLSAQLQRARKGEKISPLWMSVKEWYEEKDGKELGTITEGLSFTNFQKPVDRTLAEELYKKDIESEFSLSPSRLEKFGRCPFAHFVAYGLRPEERRIFRAAGREIGDIYHKCLMELSDSLSKTNRWGQITEEECRSLVKNITEKETADYREGVFKFGNEEKYKGRRIEDACFQVCWALIRQVRAGKVIKSRYEVPFGRGRAIEPITVKVGDSKVYIEGKIDRVDEMQGDRIKIIDYKTGNENFNMEEAKAGYRLQLLLYLKAAQEESKKPAGVFYFRIREPKINLTGVDYDEISVKIEKDMRKAFRLNGVMVDSNEVIEGIAGDFEGYSDIVPLRNGKEGISSTGKDFLLSEEEFHELQSAVDTTVINLCRDLTEGRIDITPKKSGEETPCTFCDYKSICRFDLNFSGCRYDIIKK